MILKKRVARKTNLEAGDYRDNRSFVRLDRTNRNIPLGNLTKQTQTSVQRTTQRCYITDVLSKKKKGRKGSKKKQETKLL